MRRALRWIGLGLAAIVVLIVVAFAGGLWWLGSAGGHAWLTAQVTGALTNADTKATIAGLEGAVPFHLRLARLELADRDGTWLTVENAAVDLDAAALLRGTARIDRIAAGHILVARAPLPSTTPSQPSNEPFSLPRLPVGIELGSLDVPAIDLGAPLLGEPARLTLDGKASLHRGRADAAISLVRVGAAPGKATLALTLDDRTLTLDLEAADQSGELMAKLDPDAGTQPLDLTLKGSGPLTGWHGRLDGSTGGGAKLGADLTLALDKGWAASIKGTAEIAALLADQVKPTAGTDIAFDIAAAGPKDKPITLDHADLRLAAGSVAAKGWFDPAKQTLDATATIKGDVHTLEGVAGQPVQGNFQLDLGMKGAVARPTASIRLDAHGLSAGENGVGTVTAKLDLVTGTDDLLHITGGGRFDGIKAAGAPPPDALGDRLDWTVDLTADKQASRIQLGKATASGAGVAFEASGRFDGTAADGTLHLAAADLARFGGLAGLALGGSVTLDGTVASPDGKAIDAKLTGRLADLKTGIPEADGLLGGTVTLKAAGGRSAAGTLSLADLAVSGTDVNLTGHGTFDPKAEALDGKAVLSLPRLAALGAGYAGQATVTVDATGKPNDPAVTAQVDGTGIEAGGRKIDRLAVTAKLASLIQRSVALQAKLDAGQLSATLAGTVAQTGDAAYAVKDLKLAGPGTRLAVDGTVDLAAKRGSGSIDGAVNDLVAWAPLAGMPLGGGVKITGKLAGTAAKLDLDATHLAVGASADNGRTTLEHLGLAADLSDIWARPRGKLTLDVTKLVAAGASVDHAKLAAASDKAGAFGFTLDGAGTAQKPFQVAAQGSLALGPGSDATLRLAKFDGKFADLPFDLRRQLTLARKGTGMSFADLALAVGQGSITGAGNADGKSLKFDLDGKNLSISALGALAGQTGTEGTLGFSAKLSGSPARPAGAVTVAVPDLKLAAATHPDLPPVGVAVTAELAPGRVDVKGKVDGLKNQAIGFYGHGPLQIKPDLSGVVIPPDGAILFKLEGEGRLETLSEMLPLGEDRVGGAFTIDLSVGGTVAHPDAGGQLAIRDGRYDNDASGMTLRALTVDLAGNQQSFVLRSLAGNDGGQGTVGASGRVDLAAAGGPALDLKAELKSFTAARGDTATAIVSGTAAVSGPLSGPAVKAAITLDRADINIPDQLPPNVAKLDVVRIDSRYPNRQAPQSQAAPPFAATLDIDFSSPGQCFVRGRGLDSEWRGKLHVGGTSAAPVVTGQFEVANGTFAVLSHTFTIQRGIVGFAGSTNPELDLLATAKTADITANVLLQGSPTSPTLKLTSTPELPQDEVLSRVLFGTSVGQVSAVQGLQLAAAAASLASGGGPGVLDRVRNATGLDRLTLNSDNTSTSSGSSSSSQKGALGGASVSGGKYVAPGVFVGVDQGAGAGSTKARVEVEIVPRVTVDATVGTGSESTSMGVNYKFDY